MQYLEVVQIAKKAKFMGEVTATINMIPELFMDMSFPYSSIVIWLHSNFNVLMSEKYNSLKFKIASHFLNKFNSEKYFFLFDNVKIF